MEFSYKNVILRDMKQSDIEDYVRWFTTETEWMNWDAPWETDPFDEETERKRRTREYEASKAMPDDELRWHFEVECDGKHIGWINSYLIDENYDWISYNRVKEGQKVYQTIGITLPDPGIRSKGLGTMALAGVMVYYADHGCKEICTQTWSGNDRMVRVAEKLGFTVCDREKGNCEVRGETYDGLTFYRSLEK